MGSGKVFTEISKADDSVFLVKVFASNGKEYVWVFNDVVFGANTQVSQKELVKNMDKKKINLDTENKCKYFIFSCEHHDVKSIWPITKPVQMHMKNSNKYENI